MTQEVPTQTKPGTTNKPPSSAPSTVRGTAIVGSLTMVSRVLGFVREMIVARLFGDSWIADAYFVAFRIPNLLRSFVAEGALTSAFVPIFTTQLEKGHEKAQGALSAITGFLLQVTALLAIGGIILSPGVVALFAPGFLNAPEKYALCVRLTQIMFPFIVTISLVGMLNGALTSVGIFGTSALSQVVLNAVLIIGGLACIPFSPHLGSQVLAASVVVGGIFGIIVQIPALKRAGFHLRPIWNPCNAVTLQVVTLMIPAMFSAAIYQITIFLNTLMASLLAEGSVSWLFYADRLTQLPVGIFSVALATVLLPALSRAEARGDRETFAKELGNALRFTSFFMLPLAALIALFAEPVITLVLEGGRFSHSATLSTAHAVQVICFGLWGMSCHSMIVRAFIAKRDTTTPALVGIASLVLTVVLSLVFMGLPHQKSSGGVATLLLEAQLFLRAVVPSFDLGHVGLVLASAISSTSSFLLLSFILLARGVSVSWRGFIFATVRSTLSVGGAIGMVHLLAPQNASPLVGISIGGTLFLVTFVALALILRTPEIHESRSLIARVASSKRSR